MATAFLTSIGHSLVNRGNGDMNVSWAFDIFTAIYKQKAMIETTFKYLET